MSTLLREALPAELNLVRDSWSKDMFRVPRGGRGRGFRRIMLPDAKQADPYVQIGGEVMIAPNTLIAAHRCWVDRTLQQAKVHVLTFDGDDWERLEVLSWACHDRGVLHWIWTKGGFRKQGLARNLLQRIEADNGTLRTSHLNSVGERVLMSARRAKV